MTSLSTHNGVTSVERADLGIVVASFHKQGDWRLRCYISPDEFIPSKWASRETALSVALKHAAKF